MCADSPKMSASQSDPMTRHAAQPPAAPDVLQYFAITAAWAGDKELALQQLEAGLRAPDASQMLSYGALKLLPFWDPLRGDPRFEKIVESLAPKGNAATSKK
jgi:hypothetical protein